MTGQEVDLEAGQEADQEADLEAGQEADQTVGFVRRSLIMSRL